MSVRWLDADATAGNAVVVLPRAASGGGAISGKQTSRARKVEIHVERCVRYERKMRNSRRQVREVRGAVQPGVRVVPKRVRRRPRRRGRRESRRARVSKRRRRVLRFGTNRRESHHLKELGRPHHGRLQGVRRRARAAVPGAGAEVRVRQGIAGRQERGRFGQARAAVLFVLRRRQDGA